MTETSPIYRVEDRSKKDRSIRKAQVKEAHRRRKFFRKVDIWVKSSGQSLDSDIESALLNILYVKSNTHIAEIDLEEISKKFASDSLNMIKKFFPEASGNLAMCEEKICACALQDLIQGFEKIQSLGLIEVLSSQDWKRHTVKIIPVWDLKESNESTK